MESILAAVLSIDTPPDVEAAPSTAVEPARRSSAEDGREKMFRRLALFTTDVGTEPLVSLTDP
jgi:hypothetical protein